MKKQIFIFLHLLVLIFFWLSIIGAVTMGLLFVFTFDLLIGVAFLIFGAISLIYVAILKKFPRLRKAHSTFLDLLPPV